MKAFPRFVWRGCAHNFTVTIGVLISALPLLAMEPGETQHLANPNDTPQGLTSKDWTSIQAAYQAHRHAMVQMEDGYRARNPEQQWQTQFDGRGFTTQPGAGGWQWGLELRSYGFADQKRAIAGKADIKAEGARVIYRWDATVQEWFVNDRRGLEHGFTVQQRPANNRADAHLQFDLAVRGDLRPEVSADGAAISFVNANGGAAVTYAGLKVWDADSKILPARFVAQEDGVRLTVDERGARYPLTIDPIAQQAYLKPAVVGTTQAGDQFGSSVAVSGDTVVVGARQEDSSTTGVNSTPDESAGNSGAAYVFIRSGTTWTQQAYLKPAAVGTTQAGDQFGISVAVSGDTVVVGANGEDSSTTGVNSTPDESAGLAGAAYVFTRSGTTWTQQAYLKPAAVGTTQASDEFGISVAVSGDTVVVGARLEDSSTTGVNSTPDESAGGSGAAYVFTRSGTTWTQQAYLKPAAVGTTQAGDQFGWSVAVAADTVVVGAIAEDSSTTGVNSTADESAVNAGAAYVFTRSGTTWTQQAYLKPAAVGTSQADDQFGRAVAVSGDTVVVGAIEEDSSTTGVNSTADESASQSGAAYVFTRSGTTWTQQAYLKPAAVGTTQAGDQFGSSVAVSGDTVVVGASLEDSSTTGVNSTPDESAVNAGAAYVFTRSGTTWTEQAYLKPAAVGTTQADDRFGNSVAVSGDTVVVGAFLEDSSTTGVNSTPNESASGSGAAYVFTRFGPVVTNTNDMGAGSLRQALLDADDGDTITFDIPTSDPGYSDGVWTINLTTGELVVDKNVVINGLGADVLVVQRAAADFRIFHVSVVDKAATDGSAPTLIPLGVTIQGMTIRDGAVSNVGDRGGAIYNNHTALTLNNCVLSQNFATYGGAIYNDGATTGAASLTITNSVLFDNLGFFGGGGIYNDGSDGNAGVTVTNTTFNNCGAFGDGGAIYNSGNSGIASVIMTSCTLSGNADGISNQDGSVTLGNTIITDSVFGANIINSGSGTVTSSGYNLSDDDGAGFLIGAGDQINTDPILGPLKDNGGPSFTHAPLSNSPAIDRGKDIGATGQDQRGSLRPVTYNDPSIVPPIGSDRSDIGAVELPPGVQPSDAASHKTHGGAGSFPIDLPLTGTPGIECRSGGVANDYQVILNFASPVSFSSPAAVTSGSGSVVSDTGNGTNQITLNLTGVTNAQIITLALFDANDGVNSGDVGVRMGMLIGDANGSGGVNATDVSQVKSQSGQATGAGNFRSDVIASGGVNATDVSAVKLKSGTGLP